MLYHWLVIKLVIKECWNDRRVITKNNAEITVKLQTKHTNEPKKKHWKEGLLYEVRMLIHLDLRYRALSPDMHFVTTLLIKSHVNDINFSYFM